MGTPGNPLWGTHASPLLSSYPPLYIFRGILQTVTLDVVHTGYVFKKPIIQTMISVSLGSYPFLPLNFPELSC